MSPPCPSSLADRVDAVLPQVQCRRCGFEGCRPYAEAIADDAPINRCPPGADALITTLAAITGRPVVPLDRSCGEPGPYLVARIDESLCIGCTLCIEACPVDAIVGAAKRMHAVLPVLCSGCALCVAPCPVDCIAMIPAGRAWRDADARAARDRHLARNRRLAGSALQPANQAPHDREPLRHDREPLPHDRERLPHDGGQAPSDAERAKRQAAVAAALARARSRRAAARSETK